MKREEYLKLPVVPWPDQKYTPCSEQKLLPGECDICHARLIHESQYCAQCDLIA